MNKRKSMCGVNSYNEHEKKLETRIEKQKTKQKKTQNNLQSVRMSHSWPS